jgi:hypothetical protein
MYFLREKVGSKTGTKFSSNTKSSTLSFKKSLNSSRVTGDKSITKLPSTASDRDVELNRCSPKHGGFQSTTVVSMYNVRSHDSSDDDVELVHQKGRSDGRNECEV